VEVSYNLDARQLKLRCRVLHDIEQSKARNQHLGMRCLKNQAPKEMVSGRPHSEQSYPEPSCPNLDCGSNKAHGVFPPVPVRDLSSSARLAKLGAIQARQQLPKALQWLPDSNLAERVPDSRLVGGH